MQKFAQHWLSRIKYAVVFLIILFFSKSLNATLCERQKIYVLSLEQLALKYDARFVDSFFKSWHSYGERCVFMKKIESLLGDFFRGKEGTLHKRLIDCGFKAVSSEQECTQACFIEQDISGKHLNKNLAQALYTIIHRAFTLREYGIGEVYRERESHKVIFIDTRHAIPRFCFGVLAPEKVSSSVWQKIRAHVTARVAHLVGKLKEPQTLACMGTACILLGLALAMETADEQETETVNALAKEYTELCWKKGSFEHFSCEELEGIGVHLTLPHDWMDLEADTHPSFNWFMMALEGYRGSFERALAQKEPYFLERIARCFLTNCYSEGFLERRLHDLGECLEPSDGPTLAY